ncbi:MAG TPA: MFS transporter [Chloroflexota bacterium]|nr:MFS transporter [Chloroflexota bacterium]
MRLPDYAQRQLGNALCIAAITAADGSSQTLLTPLLHEQGKNPTTIGALVAVAAVVALLMRIPGGLLYRPARVRPLMLGALGFSALATFAHPLVSSTLGFAGVRLLYGIGYSVSTTVNMAVFVESIARDGDRQRSSGIYASAMASGYTIGGLTGGFLGQTLGFQRAYAVIAALWLLAMLPVLARTVQPADEASPPKRAGSRLARAQSFSAVLLDPLVLSMVLAGFFINMQQTLFVTFTPLVLLALGLGVSQIGIMRSIFSLTNTITRPVAGHLLHRVDHHRAQTWGIMLNAAMLTLFFLPLGFGPYLLLAIVAGFGRAVAVVANTVALTQDVDPARVSRGVASGILNAALDLGNIVGPVAGGIITSAAGLDRLWLIAPPLYVCLYLGSSTLLQRRRLLAGRSLAGLER